MENGMVNFRIRIKNEMFFRSEIRNINSNPKSALNLES